MIISYNDFCKDLLQFIDKGEDLYLSVLKKVIDSPERYCGLFRLTNAKTKLVQNVTQSNEIKFGNFFEDMTTDYISRLGYHNLEKKFRNDSNKVVLDVDQFFYDDSNNYFMVEQKMRDDHDSTKKVGQFSNFIKKIKYIRSKYPTKHLNASMWFVDNELKKNEKYYSGRMNKKKNIGNTKLNLYYGSEFFDSLSNGKTVWEEIISNLKEYRKENDDNTIAIPDFGSSPEMLTALTKLDKNHWKKLNCNEDRYILLRKELFSNGNNIGNATAYHNQD